MTIFILRVISVIGFFLSDLSDTTFLISCDNFIKPPSYTNIKAVHVMDVYGRKLHEMPFHIFNEN